MTEYYFTKDLEQKYGIVKNETCTDTKSCINMEYKTKFYKHKKRGRCSLCDSDSSSDESSEYYANEKFNFDDKQFGLVFEPLSNTKGNIHTRLKGDLFNHASCQCETYLAYSRSEQKVVPVILKISYDIDFNQHKITMNYVPSVKL